MLITDEANTPAKWIQNFKTTYKENPKLNKCITWFEWKYEDKELSPSDKNSIATLIRYNSEE